MKTLLLAFITLFALTAAAKTVRYELNVTNEKVNVSGKKEVDFALLINRQLPAPVLEFTEGDDAEITVINHLKDDEVSIHWHGILLPPEMDGVAYVNTPPILPGKSFTFKFTLRQHGTYWYHSHTNIQEQKGLYGAFIVHPKKPTIEYDKDLVLVLSDWSDENATQILHNLRKDGDYYLFKKNTVRSWWGAIQQGSLGNLLANEWTRMGGMDYSDVGYDAFLINGKKNLEPFMAHPGEKIRLRIINAAASTYFYASLGNLPMQIISADGVDTKPLFAKEILLGMAETYDVLFSPPEHKLYEFRITAQDGTGTASAWIGMGEKVPAERKPFPDMYALMDHSQHAGHAQHTDHSEHSSHEVEKKSEDHSHHHGHHTPAPAPAEPPKTVVTTATVDELESPAPIAYEGRVTEVKLVLDGDMERYIWHINGKAIHQDRTLTITENDVVRYTFENRTMMHHPMHLHGHFFRVLTKNGATSPLKHTVDVPPHQSRTIEFKANEPGEWMLHCHNLYHMKTGMARVVSYSSYKPTPHQEHLKKHDPHNHDHLYYRGMLEAATNHAQAEFNLMNTWDELELRTELRQDFGWQGEGDLFYKRWFNRFTHVIAGGTMVEGEGAAVVGVGYLLPMLLETHTIVDQKGRLRVNLDKRFQWTKHWYTDTEFTFRQKQPSEFEVSLMYQRQWNWSAGLMFTEHSVGVGGQWRF